MRRSLMLCCLSPILVLAACAEPPKTVTVVRVERVREPIPDELLTCRDEPPPLASKPRPSNRAMADWIADALAAGAHCRGTVAGVREIEVRRRSADLRKSAN